MNVIFALNLHTYQNQTYILRSFYTLISEKPSELSIKSSIDHTDVLNDERLKTIGF